MPQAAFQIAAAWVAKTFTVKAVAAFAIKTVAYAAVSAGVSALTKKSGKGVAQERLAQGTSLSLGEVPREAVFGVACVGGSLMDAFNHGGQYGTGFVTMCVALADHAVDDLLQIRVDGVAYAYEGDGVQPGFSGKLSVRFDNATAEGVVPPAIALANGWNPSDVGVGVTKIWITYECDETVFTQGHPRFQFVIRGLRAYDPRKDAALGYPGAAPHDWADRSTHEYAHNAALIRYALTRGIYVEGRQGEPEHLLIGRGLSAEEAPPERILAAANVCDEERDSDSSRYHVGGLVKSSDDFIAVEEMFAAAMAGSIVQREGGVEIEPGQAKAVAFTITDDDLVVGEPVTFSPFLGDSQGGRINTVIPRYMSAAQGWKDHSGPVRRDPADIVADGGPRETTLALVLVTDPDQADGCAEITRRLARLEKRASVVLPPRFAGAEDGDWIAWTSQRFLGGATARFRIERASLDAAWRNSLTLREIASSVYGVPDPVEDLAEPPPPPPPVDAMTLPGATAQAVILPGETSVIPAVRFRWDTPVDPAVRAIRGEVRVQGGTEVATSRTEDLTLGEAGWIVTNGVTPSATLQARLVPIGDPSRPVLPSAWVTVTTGALVAEAEDPRARADIQDVVRQLLRGFSDLARDQLGEADRRLIEIGDLVARLRLVAETDPIAAAAVLNETVLIQGEDGLTLAQVLSGLRAADGDALAAVLTEQLARIDGDAAEALARTTAIAAIGDDIAATDLALRAYTDSEISEATADLTTTAELNAAIAASALSLESYVDSEITSATASLVTQVEYEGLEATVATVQSVAIDAQGTANALVGVLLDVNGYVSGTVSENNGSDSSFSILTDVFRLVSPGGGTRAEFEDGIWDYFYPAISVRRRDGVGFGGTDYLTTWIGPTSVAVGAETKANAYIYESMVTPFAGGSGFPSGGGGGSSGYAAGRREVNGVILSADGGAWVNLVSFTLQGVPSSPSLALEYTITDAAYPGGTATTVELRLLEGATVIDTGPGAYIPGDGSGFANSSIGGTGSGSGSVTYTLQRRVTSGGGATVDITFGFEAAQSI